MDWKAEVEAIRGWLRQEMKTAHDAATEFESDYYRGKSTAFMLAADRIEKLLKQMEEKEQSVCTKARKSL